MRGRYLDVRPPTLDLDAYRTDAVIELSVDPQSVQKALDEIGKSPR